MPQRATIESIPQAYRMLKQMRAQEVEWGEDYRRAGAEALRGVLEQGMAARVDRHLAEMAERGEADRRNGSYGRWLMTELGEIELRVPRTRRYSALGVVRAYAARAPHIDQMILACFVLGLSTRKVAIALQPVLGRRISPGTVSQVAKLLDGAVAAFHRRPLKDHYPVLMLDGVVLARKTGLGALRRPVLVALGLHPDGKKEILDYRLATAESAQWELFLSDLFRRGLEGKNLEMICTDGGKGLLAALPTVYPNVAVQRCWAHKVRNVLNKVKKADQPPSRLPSTPSSTPRTSPRPVPLPAASLSAGNPLTPPPSNPCAAISTICSPVSVTLPKNERPCAPPMPSNAGSAKFADVPDPWVSSRIVPPWIVSSSPSSLTKTMPRESLPSSP